MSVIMSSQSSFYYSANDDLESELERPSQQVINSLDDDPLNDDLDPFNGDPFDDDPFDDNPELESNLMPLPPEAIYNSKQALFNSIQEWAQQYKYAFRIGRSKKISEAREKVVYECDRAGPEPARNRPQNDRRRPRERVRLTSTTKTGCQFSVVGIQVGDAWELRHRPDPKFSTHNHSPSLSASTHPSHRRFTKELIEKARELHNAGDVPLIAL